MKTAKDIIRLIGSKNLQAVLGVTNKSISYASVHNSFPARWYVIIKSECDRLGVDCPDELFSFIRQPQDEDAA